MVKAERRVGLPPVVGQRPFVLILGSFPSQQSLQKQEYYANPMNGFWRMIEGVVAVPANLPYKARIEEMTRSGIALWDVIAACRRAGSADSAIKDPEPNPVLQFLTEHATVRFVALNGGTAAEVAHRLVPRLFSLDGVVTRRMPSTSSAYAIPFRGKVAQWSVIEEYLAEAS